MARSLTLLIALVCVALVIATAVLGWSARREWLENDRKSMENLAYSVAQHADATLSQTDTVALDIAERVEEAWPAEVEPARLRHVLVQKAAQQKQLAGLLVLDATGRELASSEAASAASADAKRDYFIYHRDHESRVARIGAPEHDRATGEWVIPLSRRIEMPGGRFGGVVLAKRPADAGRHAAFAVDDRCRLFQNLQ